MRFTAPGITIELPAGWEAVVDGGSGPSSAPDGPPRLRTPRTHIANFGLAPERGDYGSGAVEGMRRGHSLICLLEESPEAVGSSLHAHSGIPSLRSDQFAADAMQRPRRGQSGTQAFFHTGGRAFVLYVVLAEDFDRQAQVDAVNRVLSGITFTD